MSSSASAPVGPQTDAEISAELEPMHTDTLKWLRHCLKTDASYAEGHKDTLWAAYCTRRITIINSILTARHP